ncbi:MAG: hypothetical protein ACOCP8_03920 [archaeon]
MNWYKKAQKERERWEYNEDTMYDYYENHDETIMNQVSNFNESKPGDVQPWRLIPFQRLKKIWTDYMKLGFVRDVKGIELIEDIIVENVKKIHANTILMGHTSLSPELLSEEYGVELNESEEHDYGDWAVDNKGQWRISDYALGQLINGTLELMSAQSPEEKLTKIDFILNIVHRRSDIASWFVEGGEQALSELSNQSI